MFRVFPKGGLGRGRSGSHQPFAVSVNEIALLKRPSRLIKEFYVTLYGMKETQKWDGCAEVYTWNSEMGKRLKLICIITILNINAFLLLPLHSCPLLQLIFKYLIKIKYY